ncbi:MAG: UPF0716 protein FxsA [Cellvibrionaceae bacterium]|jgi:UPF0716 protein FxsA
MALGLTQSHVYPCIISTHLQIYRLSRLLIPELNLRTLLIIFIVVPIVEMWLLIKVGGAIGALPTIGLVFLTAIIGLQLLRIQGISTMSSARRKLQANELPVREIADAVFYAFAGALLLTPGFFTDAIGFACLIPGIRTWLVQFLLRYALQKGRFHFQVPPGRRRHQSDRVIEGDFKRDRDE